MDLICPRCGEPWDMDCLHDEAAERHTKDGGEYADVYASVAGDFRARGCLALTTAYGSQPGCVREQSHSTLAASATYELLGDDMDGAAAMLEDMGIS